MLRAEETSVGLVLEREETLRRFSLASAATRGRAEVSDSEYSLSASTVDRSTARLRSRRYKFNDEENGDAQ
jgi:hypothetical protein